VGQLYDQLGAPIDGALGGPTTLPQEDNSEELPSVDWHPVTGQYLVGGRSGEATGISIIDPIRNGALTLVERPTHRVRYLPDGSGFIAIHPDEAGGNSLVLYRTLEPDVTGVNLIENAEWLRPTTLDWGGASPWLPDSDDDGLVDGSDPCPTQPARDRGATLVPAIPNQSGQPYTNLQLIWNGQDYFATWSYNTSTGRGHLIRLDREGTLLQDFGIINSSFDGSAAVEPLWYGDRYRMFHLASRPPVTYYRGSKLWVTDLTLRGVLTDRAPVDLGEEGEPRHYRWITGIR
jgi:hypothetical protein